jgi:phage shock protein A
VSFWSELLLWLRYHLSGGLKEVEDPREVLDRAYARQLELQAKLRRAVADVVTARKRLELQARQLGPAADRLAEQARGALEQGRQDLARAAVAQRAMLRAELDELGRQSAALGGEETRLLEAARQLDLQIQQFRIRRDTVRATFAAAHAREQLGEAMAEASLEGSDLAAVVRRAEDRVAETRARALALEGLLARGALAPGDPVQRALEAPNTRSEVDAELARMEEDLLWGERNTGLPPDDPAGEGRGGGD